MQQYKWGLDLGGTKIEGVILDTTGTTPKVVERMRIPTEADKGYEHICDQVGRIVDMLADAAGHRPDGIGIGHPGALDPITGTMKNANTTALNGRPFDKDLEKRLGFRVKLANDANCFAVAEALMGSVPEVLPHATSVFGVILGTGVGGGWVVHGKVLNGRQGIAGEWGHNLLDEHGPDCYCGRKGCVETLMSGPFLERYYAQRSGTARNLREIAALAETGDEAAVQTLDRLIHYFGKAMAVVINIMDPDAIVLGGGVGNIDRLYTDGVREVGRYVFNPRVDTVFLRPKLGDSAGVFGAALL
jgi:fructokinase